VTKKGGTTFTFVTKGIEAALEQAQAAAGDKDVLAAGGARIVQQYLEAGLLDELQINLAPVLLGVSATEVLSNLSPSPPRPWIGQRGCLSVGTAPIRRKWRKP